jgi:hypothetical protein
MPSLELGEPALGCPNKGSLEKGKAALVPTSPGLGDLSQKWWTSSASSSGNSQEVVVPDSAECTQASSVLPASPDCTQMSKVLPASPDCTQASEVAPASPDCTQASAVVAGSVECSPSSSVVPDSVNCSPTSPPKRRKQALPATLAQPYLAFKSRSVAPSRSLVRAVARKTAPASSSEQRRRRREAALLSGDPVEASDGLQKLLSDVVEVAGAFNTSIEDAREVLCDVYAATHSLKQTVELQVQAQAMTKRLQDAMKHAQGLTRRLHASIESHEKGAGLIELAVAGSRAALRDQKVYATDQLKMLRLSNQTAALMASGTAALRHMVQQLHVDSTAPPPSSPTSPRIPFLDSAECTPSAPVSKLIRGTPSSDQPTRVAKSTVLALFAGDAVYRQQVTQVDLQPERRPAAKRDLDSELAGVAGSKGLYPQNRPYVPAVLDFDSRTPDLQGLTLDDPAVLRVPPTLYSPGTPPKTIYPFLASPQPRKALHLAQVSPRPRKAGVRRVVKPTSKASFRTSWALDVEDLTPEKDKVWRKPGDARKGSGQRDEHLRLPREPFTPPGPRHPIMRELDTEESAASPVFDDDVCRPVFNDDVCRPVGGYRSP